MTDPAPGRGSLRSRGAALVSTLTLRQISAVLPPEQAWGLFLSRRILAGVMDAFGPPLAADIRTGGSSCELQVWPDQGARLSSIATVITRGRQGYGAGRTVDRNVIAGQ
jgi:hypothetical protein